MSELLIKNGRVIDPANKMDMIADILVRDGKIAELGRINKNGCEVINAENRLVTPGLVDMHVHLREPGEEEEETIASGSTAAVAGGFTSIACMPNTNPTIDNEATVDYVYRQASNAGKANVFAVGAITKGRAGKELAEMGQMVRGGAVAFTDDGSGVQNPAVMLRALQYVRMFDKVLMQHCQDNALAGSGCMNSGYQATILGLPGMPALAEELMLYRDIQLAKKASVPYHAQHISTQGSADLIRQARKQGLKVTAEVTPHHLLFTDEACISYDPNYKMNPPLRTQEDIIALQAAVADGTIDCLASDHAPHLRSEKELEFLQAPFGIISLDCALGLYVKALIETDIIDWPRLIEMMTCNPARILRINKGTLSIGCDADITIIDPDHHWQVDIDQFKSRSRNCPYHGWELSARPVCTIVGGRILHRQSS
ncbi:MAG: dihydroorotase [Sedimentisphaerales bacterium]|nr:dihydroorotase [Sedimentisphaerales bacterium]